jgi:hypothetical protein
MSETLAGAAVLWSSKGWLHRSPVCELIARDEVEEVSVSARGRRCMCLVAGSAGSPGAAATRHRVRSRVSNALKAALARGEVSHWQIVEAMVVGMVSSDPLVQAARAAASTATPRLRGRHAVAEAVVEGPSPRVLEDAASVLRTGLEVIGAGLRPRDLERWAKAWSDSGDADAARRSLLDEPASFAGADLEERLAQRDAWEAVADLLEAASVQMTQLVDDAPARAVLVHQWRELVSERGSDDVVSVLGAHEYVHLGDDLALLVPACEAEWLERTHPYKPSTKIRRVIDLGEAGSAFEASVETMMVLWQQAGGTWKREIDAYGVEKVIEGEANVYRAYEAARAIEE